MPRIAGIQIRSARSALNWSVAELAARTGVGDSTIKRYEMIKGVPLSRKGHLETIRSTLESAGIEFIGTPEDRPGIRIDLTK